MPDCLIYAYLHHGSLLKQDHEEKLVSLQSFIRFSERKINESLSVLFEKAIFSKCNFWFLFRNETGKLKTRISFAALEKGFLTEKYNALGSEYWTSITPLSANSGRTDAVLLLSNQWQAYMFLLTERRLLLRDAFHGTNCLQSISSIFHWNQLT